MLSSFPMVNQHKHSSLTNNLFFLPFRWKSQWFKNAQGRHSSENSNLVILRTLMLQNMAALLILCGIIHMDHLKAIYIWAFCRLDKEKAYILRNKRTMSGVIIKKSICSWFLHPYNIHNHLVCTSIHISRPTATRERPSSYLQREREAGAVQRAESAKQMKHTNIQTPSHKPDLFELRVQHF